MNLLAPPKKKTTVSSTLRLHAVALLSVVEGRGHCCRREWEQLNITSNDIVPLFLVRRENALAKVTKCPSGCWECKTKEAPAQLLVGNVQSGAGGIW